MADSTRDDELWEIVKAKGLERADYAIVQQFLALPPAAREAIQTMILKTAERIRTEALALEVAGRGVEQGAPAVDAAPERSAPPVESDPEIEADVEEYRRERYKAREEERRAGPAAISKIG